MTSSGQVWLDALPDPTFGLDADGTLGWANRAAADFFGWDRENWIGRAALDLIHPDDQSLAVLSLSSVQDKAVGTPIELRVSTKTGWRLVEVVGASHLGEPGIDSIVFTLRDLTERRRWELGHGDEALFRAIVQNAAALLMLLDPDHRVIAASGAVTRQLGIDPEAVVGRLLPELSCSPDRDALTVALGQASSERRSATSEPVRVEVGLINSHGVAIPYELSLVNLADDPTVPGVIVSGHNIAQLRAAQQALADMALRDPLTMVANRAGLDKGLDVMLDRGRSVTVAFIDLDDFKSINDRYGHRSGDRVLRILAERLVSCVRPGDLVARYGGDEFVVVTEADGSQAAVLTERLRHALSSPVNIGDQLVPTAGTVGTVVAIPGDRSSDLLDRADQAMYEAKLNGAR